MKDFGFGKAGLEGVIQGEAEDIVRYLSKMENKDYKSVFNSNVWIFTKLNVENEHWFWNPSYKHSLDNCSWKKISDGRSSSKENDGNSQQVFKQHLMYIIYNNYLYRLFKAKFALEYLFPIWGAICWVVPGLQTRKTCITELRKMFRAAIKEHEATLDSNHPRY